MNIIAAMLVAVAAAVGVACVTGILLTAAAITEFENTY